MPVYGLMWDSATGDYPPGARLNAYYVNGRFAHTPYTVGRGHVWVDIFGDAPGKALFLDVEPGAATPAQVPGWLDARAKVAGTGGIYCNRSNLAAVESAADGRPHLLWLATLDGTVYPTLTTTGQLVAVQAFPESMLWPGVDASVVVDSGFWADHAAQVGA